MHEEMRSLLNAYLDGELQGKRLVELKLHLVTCQACQKELTELRRVSELLHAAPTPEFMPAEKFVSNLTLNLPRRPVNHNPEKPSSLIWWLVPAGLLGLFFFVRTVFLFTNMVTVADLSGLLGSSTAWLSAGQQTLWFGTAMNLTGGQMSGAQSTLSALNSAGILTDNFLISLIWQTGIFLLYSGWLAAWWLRRNKQLVKATASPSRS